jgi:hypothetical protein
VPKIKWSAKSTNRGKKPTKSMLIKHFRPVVKQTRDEAYRHYTKIVGKWSSKNRPKFKRVTRNASLPGGGYSIYSSVGINERSTPLYWLDQGTQIRYRMMSHDWQSKTYPYIGVKSQRSGKGYASGWGIAPGIEPRGFQRGIIIDIYPDFHINARRAFRNMVKELRG